MSGPRIQGRALLFFFGISLLSRPALAGAAFYVDAGGGYGRLRNSAAFYNGGVTNGTASAYATDLGVWTTLTNGDPVLEFQFGLQNRYDFGSDNVGRTLGLNMSYASARIQISRIFLAFGYSPFVMSSIGGSSASSAVLSHASGASAMMGEAGILLPVTPKFSMGGSGTYEVVKVGGSSSPNPIVTGTFFFRFYFGFGEGSRKSNEFRGWRYPFGREIH